MCSVERYPERGAYRGAALDLDAGDQCLESSARCCEGLEALQAGRNGEGAGFESEEVPFGGLFFLGQLGVDHAELVLALAALGPGGARPAASTSSWQRSRGPPGPTSGDSTVTATTSPRQSSRQPSTLPNRPTSNWLEPNSGSLRQAQEVQLLVVAVALGHRREACDR